MTPFFHSYLFAYLVVLGIALGCLGLLLLHALTGGEWGKVSRPVLQAGADTLPFLVFLFLPILLGLSRIYPWAIATSGHERLYFAEPFFVARAVFYFAAWSWMAKRQHTTLSGSGAGLVVYVFTVSFASFDWGMSLEPHWSSSIYGAMLMTGDVLTALAFAIVALNWQSLNDRKQTAIPDDTVHDLGNLLLAFVMLWTYMALSQYLIIWSANLPDEIGWYLARQRGGWQWVAVLLILFQFALPFAFLLIRRLKRKLKSLAIVAAGILFMRVIDVFWLTAPDFSPGRFSIHVWDVLLPLVLGGIWLFLFARCLPIEGTP